MKQQKITKQEVLDLKRKSTTAHPVLTDDELLFIFDALNEWITGCCQQEQQKKGIIKALADNPDIDSIMDNIIDHEEYYGKSAMFGVDVDTVIEKLRNLSFKEITDLHLRIALYWASSDEVAEYVARYAQPAA